MIDHPDDELIKAVTGLEGGCVACGSTCGVLTGGALGIALKHEAEIAAGLTSERNVLAGVGEYADWFAKTHGSFLCREWTRTDFYSMRGQLKYFFTVYRLSGCFWHIRGAMRYLYRKRISAESALKPEAATHGGKVVHCAQHVLEKIRENTGIGNKRLESLAFVFDGGLGLSGGLCGALAGAVTGINLLLGLPVRQMSFWQTVKGFVIGHVNLLLDAPYGVREPFKDGKQVVRSFKETAGSFECREIAGKRFDGWDDFQEFIKEARQCHELMDFAADKAIRIIRQYQ